MLNVPVQPVDSATITIIVDNVTDAFLPDQGPSLDYRRRSCDHEG
jgi:hypothetical protein